MGGGRVGADLKNFSGNLAKIKDGKEQIQDFEIVCKPETFSAMKRSKLGDSIATKYKRTSL